MQKTSFILFFVLTLYITATAQMPDTAKARREIEAAMKDFNNGMKMMQDKIQQSTDDTAHFSENEMEEEEPQTLNDLIENPDNVFILCIDLKKNPITALPEGFENLTNLSLLVIGNLPNGAVFDFAGAFTKLSQLSNLRELYILNNGTGLKTIPAGIGQLVHLKRLVCFKNAIVTIPDEIGTLHNLQELSLEMNRIVHLPSSLSKLEKLKTLELEKNPVAAAECIALQAKLPKCKITFTK